MAVTLSHSARLAALVTTCLSLAVTYACSPADPMPPERKPGIPPEAVWAGGIDGGEWILCVPAAPASRYGCRIYNDYTGTLEASGDFVLRRNVGDNAVSEGQLAEVAEGPRGLHYRYFDGVAIYLEDNAVLLPDGIIDYPFGGGGGKRARFREGIEIGQAEQY